MKIRTDFVTNSSSSSFVIAYKGFPQIDEETLKKYPFLKQYQIAVKNIIFSDAGTAYETKEGKEIDNIIDLQAYYEDNYNWNEETFEDLIRENEYIRKEYEECKKYLDQGYKILMKRVGYGDVCEDMFKKMQSDDFVILSAEPE